MAFGFLNKFSGLNTLFRQNDPRGTLRPLYNAVTAEAREEDWYWAAQVPDTLDGRFDMMCLVTALVLIRMEALGEAAQSPMARLTEVFVEDMEGQMRETGFGDVVVGKQVGKMMSALGGRLGACRLAVAPGGDLAALLERNVYRGSLPAAEAQEAAQSRVRSLVQALDQATLESLMSGRIRP
jgi:cytochrome b pre-mRNA-processing protein 3